jgi:hypothetical protein
MSDRREILQPRGADVQPTVLRVVGQWVAQSSAFSNSAVLSIRRAAEFLRRETPRYLLVTALNRCTAADGCREQPLLALILQEGNAQHQRRRDSAVRCIALLDAALGRPGCARIALNAPHC